MPEPPPRFVILHHVLSDSAHWDLMLEHGQVLATWQLAEDPALLATAAGREPSPARRIADHRLAYLEYEGPVSASRGTVTRLESGTYQIVDESPAHLTVRLLGAWLGGVFRLSAAAEGSEGTIHRLE